MNKHSSISFIYISYIMLTVVEKIVNMIHSLKQANIIPNKNRDQLRWGKDVFLRDFLK